MLSSQSISSRQNKSFSGDKRLRELSMTAVFLWVAWFKIYNINPAVLALFLAVLAVEVG
jgi:hypothetical protein